MDTEIAYLSPYTSPGYRDQRHERYGGRRRHCEESFTCHHCHATVYTLPMLSGVHNRNHCPYCLWSRHLDWHAAGDRLSACKAAMQPIGLTMKPARNKYARHLTEASPAWHAGEPLYSQSGHTMEITAGELMLVHRCSACGSISINRIAADDTAEGLLGILQASALLDLLTRQALEASAIHLLGDSELHLVKRQLFGSYCC